MATQKSRSRLRLSSKHSASKGNSKNVFAAHRGRVLSTPPGKIDLFHYMVDHIGDEVMVVNKQAKIVFVNKAAAKGLGHTPKNILNRTLTGFFRKKTSIREWQKTYFSQVKRKSKPVSFIIHRKARGGKVRAIDMTVSYLPHLSEEYILTVGRDITEHLAFQDKLRESEDRYRLLCEQAAEGILTIDLKGIILYANTAACKMFKASKAEIIGTHFKRHVSEFSLSEAWKHFRAVKKGTPVICGRSELQDQKGKVLPVEFTSTPIMRGQRVVQIHVIFRDIGSKNEVEALIKEAEKMEAVQHFIAGITHEIQQPLKGLMDYSQQLTDKYKDRYFEYIGYKEFKDIIKTLKRMNSQVKYCYDTADRLNSLNRKKARLHAGRCDANHIIRETVKMLKHPLEVSNVQIKLKLSADLPPVVINFFDLRQVVNNILTNAIQSLPPSGGMIRVKTAYEKQKGMVRIECQDNGVGIPKEILSRVFEPFFTTKSRGLEKSSGLGLYIVYSVIKESGGEISIKSDYRKGTSVTVTLPAYKSSGKRKT